MAKPNLPVAISRKDEFGFIISICRPPCMYTITFEGHPVVIKRSSELMGYSKYYRTSFAQKGTAIKLAEKLNKEFNTVDFNIREV